jgi:hypothetical protein
VKLLASLVTLYEVASGLFYSLPESLSFGFADFTLMLKLHVIIPPEAKFGFRSPRCRVQRNPETTACLFHSFTYFFFKIYIDQFLEFVGEFT